jgi:hypothetical protein
MAENPYAGFKEWRAILGVEGPRAILGHALHAFLRGAYEPAAAWKMALATSPSDLRHEVLALTGAFSGAFQGSGVFHRGLLKSAMQDAFPMRRMDDWTLGKWKKALWDLPLGRLLRPREATGEIPSWFRMLNPAGQGASRPLQWTAFKEGFVDRQMEMEIHLFDLLLETSRTLAEPRISTQQLRELHAELATEHRQLEESFSALRSFVDAGKPKLESSLPDSLSGPLLEDVKWRTDRLEGGILAFRRFMEELQQQAARPRIWPKGSGQQRLQEKLLQVTDAFPPKSEAHPETQLIATLMTALRRELETLRPRPRQ